MYMPIGYSGAVPNPVASAGCTNGERLVGVPRGQVPSGARPGSRIARASSAATGAGSLEVAVGVPGMAGVPDRLAVGDPAGPVHAASTRSRSTTGDRLTQVLHLPAAAGCAAGRCAPGRGAGRSPNPPSRSGQLVARSALRLHSPDLDCT